MSKTPGQIAAAKAKKIRREIAAFFRRNPYAKQSDCAAELGISRVTVIRHMKILKEEHERKRQA